MRYAGRGFRLPLVIAAIVAVSVAGVATAKNAAGLPAAEKVIAKYIKAIGGKKAYLAYDSRTLTGTMSMPAAGISGGLELLAASPNRVLARIEIEGLGTIREGFDGEVGWSIDPMSGPQVKKGKQLAQAKDQALYEAGLFPASIYETREVVGQVEFNGKQAWRVRLVSANGNESFAFFDVDSGLQLGAESVQETPMGSIPVTSTFSDYKEFDGVLIPTRLEQDLGPAGKQILEFSSVTGGGVDPSVFALPAEIKALLE